MNSHTLIRSAVITFSATVMATGISAESSKIHRTEADSLFTAGSYDQALDSYRALFDEDTSDWHTAHSLGLIYRYMGDYSHSEYYMTQAAQTKPDDGELWFDLAETERLNGEHEASGKHFLTAADCGYREQNAIYMSASVKAEAGLYDEVLALLERLQAPLSTSPETAALRGRCLLETGNAAKAAEAYESACTAQPGNSIYLLGFARSLSADKQYREAQEICDRIIESYPRCLTAYLLAGEAAIKNGTIVRGQDYAHAALEIKPGNSPALILLAKTYFNLDDGETAVQYYEQALNEKPYDSVVYSLIGDTWLSMTMADQAEEAYRLAVTYDWKNPLYYYKLGTANEMQGREKTAVDLYDQAIAIAGDYPEARESRNRIINRTRPRPNLTLSADFVNLYSDKALYRGDQGALNVTIINSGPGRAYDVGIILTPNPPPDGITIGEYSSLDMIPAEREYTVKIPIIADKEAAPDALTFSIILTEKYGNEPETGIQYTIPLKAPRK